MPSKTDLLKQIRDEVWNLKESPLYEYRTKNKYYPVLGEGNHDADLFFIGEAPGRTEALSGRPFCGASGKLLTEMCASIDLKREDVYITNIVKDRPPENRDPSREEIEIYSYFLDRQIEVIQPKVIVTLGRFSMEHIMQRYGVKNYFTITMSHGKEFKSDIGLTIVPLFHPAVALYNRNKLEVLKKDFQLLRKYLLRHETANLSQSSNNQTRNQENARMAR